MGNLSGFQKIPSSRFSKAQSSTGLEENWVQISGEAEVSESEEERGFESFSRDFE